MLELVVLLFNGLHRYEDHILLQGQERDREISILYSIVSIATFINYGLLKLNNSF